MPWYGKIIMFLYKSKLKSIALDIINNKVISSVCFNVICTVIYCQDLNWFLNGAILTHLSIIMTSEFTTFIMQRRKEKLAQKRLLNFYAQYDHNVSVKKRSLFTK